MKKIKLALLLITALITLIGLSAFTNGSYDSNDTEGISIIKNGENQTINLFVTHGHCSTPFGGVVEKLEVNAPGRDDQGDPLEGMEIWFEIDPISFSVCASDDLTERIRTPGLFVGNNNERITFKSTSVYTMGVDWYQVNGILSIKGIERETKIFVSGIREPEDSIARFLVLEGQLNLLDWGIDYDKIITGKSDIVPTKWLHLNMKIKMS